MIQITDKKILKMVTLFVLTIILFISIFSVKVQASKNTSLPEKHKYFASIEIEKGDTLWSLADEYMDKDFYKSKRDYINEIKKTNNLSSDKIVAGGYLLVTYYE